MPGQTIAAQKPGRHSSSAPHAEHFHRAGAQRGLLRVQSPLRHWIHRDNPSGWQIETGPVLWPLDLEAFTTEPNSRWLTPAWIHSNQAGHVTMSGERLPCHEQKAQLSILVLA